MALQQINWLQIDTKYVPSGSHIDLGQIDGQLHAVYAENLFISGLSIQDVIAEAGTDALNHYTASLNQAIEVTGSNLTVIGNLLVKGTTTAVESNIVTLGDNVIELNGSEASYGGLLVKDQTNPNKISGSLLWDATLDKWVAGPLGAESPIFLESDYINYSSSVSDMFADLGIFRQTGSFYATTNDLQMTGSVIIKGDLLVEGTTTLVQKNNSSMESLVVSGAMKIVKSQIASASLAIQNLGTWAERGQNAIIDCGDGFF